MDWKVEGQIRLEYLLLQINLLAEWQSTPPLTMSFRPLQIVPLIGAVISSFAFVIPTKRMPLVSQRQGRPRNMVNWCKFRRAVTAVCAALKYSNRPHPIFGKQLHPRPPLPPFRFRFSTTPQLQHPALRASPRHSPEWHPSQKTVSVA